MHIRSRIINLEGNDYRLDTKEQDDCSLHPYMSLNDFMSNILAEKHGLPKNPTYEYLSEHNELPFFGLKREQIAPLTDADMDAADLAVLTAKMEKQEAFDKRQKVFDDALADFQEPYKIKLIAALQDGLLYAEGRFMEDAEQEFSTLTQIPKNAWRYNQIEWRDSIVNMEKGFYAHVLIRVSSLFEQFPPRTLEKVTVLKNGDTLLIEDGDMPKPIRRSGRPTSPWPEFTTEMVRRMKNSQLPKLQKTCVIEMGEWCKENWGLIPSDTSLKTYISPFYQ